MLENVLEIGERPEDLVVYAARGKAARDWESYSRIVASLQHLGEDETLVVQSGKPVAVFAKLARGPFGRDGLWQRGRSLRDPGVLRRTV